MDVRLEDGTVVTNVPEGITQSELLARIGKTKQAKPASDPLRDIALTGRAAVEGAVGLPSMAADAFSGNLAKRLMFGNDAAPPTLSDTLKGFLDKHSYTPETQGERLAADVVGGGVSAMGAGGPLKNVVGAVVPGMVAGGATGAARESGASPLWQLLAGLVGGVGTTGAIEGVKAAGRGVKNVIDSAVVPGGSERAAGRILNEAAGANKPQVVQALESAASDVPGMKLNAGQAAAKAGGAEFSAMQKIAAETKPTPYAALETSQEEARKAALGSVGKTKQALKAAVAEREANAAEAYGAIKDKLISPKSNTQLMEEAIQKRAMSKAEALRDKGRFDTFASQQNALGENFTPVPGMPRVPSRVSNFPENVAAGEKAGIEAGGIAAQRFKEEDFLRRTMDLLDNTVDDKALTPLLKRPSMQAAVKEAIKGAEETGGYFPTKQGENFSIANLQRMKQALDDAVKDPAAFGIKATEAKEIMGTRKAFVDWLSNKSPEWKAARQGYAADSRPVNQMQVGQYLQDKLASPLEGTERSASFAQAVRDAPGTIKRSSGQSMYDELGQVLTPQQEGTVNSVLNNLKNETTFKDLASKGMPAARRIVGQSADPIPQVNMLNRAMMVTNAIVRRLEGKGGRAAIESMADIMQDPQETAALLKAATPIERATLIDALTRSAAGSMGAQQ